MQIYPFHILPHFKSALLQRQVQLPFGKCDVLDLKGLSAHLSRLLISRGKVSQRAPLLQSLWMTLGAEETLAAAAPPLRVHSPLKMPSNLSSSLLGMCRSLSGRNRPKLCVPCDKKYTRLKKKNANMSYVTAPISVRRRKFSIFTIFNGSSDSYENVLIGSVNNTFGGLDFNVGAPSVLLMCPHYLHF